MRAEVSLLELQQLTSKVDAAESVLDECLARWFAIGFFTADTLSNVSLPNKLKLCDAFIARPGNRQALDKALKRTIDCQRTWERAIRMLVEKPSVRALGANSSLRLLSLELEEAIRELSRTVVNIA